MIHLSSRFVASHALACILGLAGLVLSVAPRADEFTAEDVRRWDAAFQEVVDQGRTLWSDQKLGGNGVTCAQCHPNAANTHPETYPKFQKQLARVILLWEMIDWCLRNPLEGKPLAPDDPKMIALQAYMTFERRGVPLAPGKH